MENHSYSYTRLDVLEEDENSTDASCKQEEKTVYGVSDLAKSVCQRDLRASPQDLIDFEELPRPCSPQHAHAAAAAGNPDPFDMLATEIRPSSARSGLAVDASPGPPCIWSLTASATSEGAAAPRPPGSDASPASVPSDQLEQAQHALDQMNGGSHSGGDDDNAAHANERRELHIWAVPLLRNRQLRGASSSSSGASALGGGPGTVAAAAESRLDSLVFLPVTGWREDPEPQLTGWKGQMQDRVRKLQEAAVDQWDAMGEKEEGTFQQRVHRLGCRIAEDMSPEERLTKSIPKNVSKVIIHHPSMIAPDLIMDKLQSLAARHGAMSTAKTAVAAIMLPLAFGVDTVVIPGPALWRSASAASGSRRLTHYIGQSGAATAVRVNYCGDSRLDEFYEAAQDNAEGVLGEEEIEQLVSAVRERELLQPLLELRARHKRMNTTMTGDGYALLSPPD